MYSRDNIEELSPQQRREALARLLEARQQDAVYPLSPSQFNMWFELQMDPGSSAYNMPLPFSITSELRADVVRNALEVIVARHSVLRSIIIVNDEGPVQRVLPRMDVALPVRSIENNVEKDWLSQILRLAHEQSRAPFDLAQGPLFRFELIRLENEHHVLLMTIHHIVLDGWSIGVLLKEFAEVYLAMAAGKVSPLAPLRVSFRDFVNWQGRQQNPSGTETQIRYWKERLKDAPSAIDLPLDFPRPPVRSFRGASHSFNISPVLAQRLHTSGKQLGVTPFTILLAAIHILLSRVSGQADVVLGVSVANREREEYWGLLGPFSNILPMRAKVASSSRVADFLACLKTETIEDLEHSDLPLTKIVEAVNPVRDPSRSTLFQVGFDYQNSPWPTVVAETVLLGDGVTFLNAENGTTKAELNFSVSKVGEGLLGIIEFCTDLFLPSTIQRYASWYLGILEQLISEPQARLSDLLVLDAEERQQVLTQSRGARDESIPARCIQELFDRQVQQYPDRDAVISAQERFTYKMLQARAHALAGSLADVGVRPRMSVGLLLQRSVDMVAGMLAILKAGASYVPLDPMVPFSRLQQLLADSGTRVLLTSRALAAQWSGWEHVICTIEEARHESLIRVGQPADGGDSAYTIYTSGSTGLPKGVTVTHRALVNFTEWAVREFGLGANDRVLQFASVSFDTSAEEIYPCLAAGATLVLRDDQMLGSPAAFLRACDRSGITVLDLPTAYWHELVSAIESEGLLLPASVRLVIIGGEAASVEMVRAWHRHVEPRVRLLNTYGPSEATIVATVCELIAADGATGSVAVSIGRPISNVQVYVVDGNGGLALPGTYGEIVIGGAGVATGYLGRPELTASKFTANPVDPEAAGLVYWTGDIGRYLPDGRLEFRGRLDRQIKLRGFRIELDEVQTVLQQHPDIEDAVVLLDDRNGEARLVAYSVRRPGALACDAAVRGWMGERLPYYMVPAALAFINAFPRTVSGKIDRQALRAIPLAQSAVADGGEERPSTIVEQTLAEIWSSVLGIDAVNIRQTFFEQGGHSLLAMRMLSRVRRQLNVDMPLYRLFEKPTIVHFAQAIEERLVLESAAGIKHDEIVPLQQNDDEERLPLSFAQQRLWFLTQLEGSASGAYHVCGGVRLTGALDVAALRRALERLVARHEVLRTRFVSVDGQALQVVGAAETGFALRWVDLSTERSAEERLSEEVREEVGARFELETGPLIRGRLIRMSQSEHVLLVTMHHIVSDGWSMGVLVGEINRLYAAFSSGQEDPLPRLAIQYADYAIWQRRWLEGAVSREQVRYWVEELRGAPALLMLPADRARPAVQDYSGASVGFQLDERLSAGLKALSRRHGTTLFMTLLAGFGVLLSRLSGQPEVVIGTPVAGRTRTEVEPLIGLFVNTLALRIDVSSAPTVAELLAQVRGRALAAQAHQDVPFEQIVEALRPDRSLAHSPVFQAMFAWQNAPEGRLSLAGTSATAITLPQATSKVDLSLDMWEEESGVAGSFSYATALFDVATIKRWLQYWLSLLWTVVAGDTEVVELLPLPILREAHPASDDAAAARSEQIRFWAEYLKNVPASLHLPTDYRWTTDHSGPDHCLDLAIDNDLARAIRQLGSRHAVAPSTIVLAALVSILSRLSGQDDLIIGLQGSCADATASGQHHGEPLPLRIDLSGRPDTAGLLQHLAVNLCRVGARRGLPLEQLSRLAGGVARDGLFRVLFCEERPTPGERANSHRSGDRASGTKVSSALRAVDLQLDLSVSDDAISGALRYVSNRFDTVTIERLRGYLLSLLKVMVVEVDRPVGDIDLLSPAERELLLHTWNRTEREFPLHLCMHELFEEQVLRTPDAVAIVHEGSTLSYVELNERANRLAYRLIGGGVQADTRVAICSARMPHMIIGMLAILKAGGAYVPLDPAYPVERLHELLTDAEPALLLTDSAGRQALGDEATTAIPLLFLDQPLPEQASAGADMAVNPDSRRRRLTSASLAYVIYTSGSTGKPKGVMIEHRNAVNLLCWASEEFSAGETARTLFSTSINFDLSVFECFLPLLQGTAIHLVNDALSLMRQPTDVSIVNTVPSAITALLQAQAVPASMQTLNLAGEPLKASLIARIFDQTQAQRLCNLYGPSETTTYSSGLVLRRGDRIIESIGRPIANTRIYLLDGAGQPVPLGAVGEIHIGGAGVARGYLKRPDLTAARFIKDPFSSQPGARMYRTGDLGRYGNDGNIEYLGRNDHQVKIRGYRIELGEIEARLAGYPGLRESIVLARNVTGDLRLIAYVVPQADTVPVDVAALRNHLSRQLPDFMVPAAFVQLDRLPLTSNGKLDRQALPAPDSRAFGAGAYEAPVGDIECRLAGLWRSLLGIERVGRNDDFLDLGGHSLLGIRLLSLLRQHFYVEITLAGLFASPTLAALAQDIEAGDKASAASIDRADRNQYRVRSNRPLSFAQQRLWFLTQLEGSASGAYHVCGGVRLTGALDVAALRRALERLVARHEVLRTRFVSVDGQALQVVGAAETGFALRWVDLSTERSAEERLSEEVREEVGARFELETGPLIRGRLIRMSQSEHVLLVTMHHIVSDGWSMGVLVGEINRLYAAFSSGQEDPLPRLAIQYADYAIWQRRWLEGAVSREQVRYWVEELRGAPALLMLPADRARPAVQDYSGASVGFQLDERLSAGLKALSRRHGTTLFMTLLAGFGVLLSRLSGQPEVVIGTPVAGRTRTEVEPLIGLFVNTLALRIDVSSAPTVAELLAQVRGRALAAQAHQDVPFEQIVEALRPDRSLAHSPIFQAMFAWQNAPESSLRFDGIDAQPVAIAEVQAPFDLSMDMWEEGPSIAGEINYATALFDAATIERWLVCWRILLQALIADEGAAVNRLPILPDEEHCRLLSRMQNGQTAVTTTRLVHRLFEEQVARTPNALALVFDDEQLSYADLDLRADQLARHLVAIGIGPESRVALALPRSTGLIVAILATLKAGGAYVPLDLTHPAERLALVLGDCQPSALLTQHALSDRFGTVPAGLPILHLDSDAEVWSPSAAESPASAASNLNPSNLAYVIYTSGSTGAPKGVMVEHGALCRRLAGLNDHYGVGPCDRVLQFANTTFDLSVEEIFVSLINGAALVLRADGWLDSPARFARRCTEAGITVLDLPTRFWQELAHDASLRLPDSLRLVIVGGEEMTREAYENWQGRNRVPLLNTYGPTEAVIVATVHAFAPAAPYRSTIGRPVVDTPLYILDAHLQPVPVGVYGEIHIGGPALARGYLHSPELNQQCFLVDPFSPPEAAGRLYKTGDLGRWCADGSIEFLGRNDQQVKIRGFRVEPGEIEARLRVVEGIRQVAVVRREDRPGNGCLVAYYSTADGLLLPPESLRAQLAPKLPDYMLPAAFVHVRALPVNSSGKLDRSALPAPDAEAFDGRGYEEPRGDIEISLARLWTDLLGVERIGRNDHFFDRGGHSLLAVRLISRIHSQLGLEVTLAQLFSFPTLAGFAQCAAGIESTELSTIEPMPRSAPLPVSFAQQRLWFLGQLQPDSATYNIPCILRLEGELNVVALRQSFDELAHRHEILRTRFRELDGQPVQIADAIAEGVSVGLVELNELDEQAREQRVRRLINEEAARPFDLDGGRLMRVSLLQLHAREHILLFNIHHIIADGWSIGILTRELALLYAAFIAGRPSPLKALPVQYADYAVWQRNWLSGERLDRQLAYWSERLDSAPSALPLHPDRQSRTSSGAGAVLLRPLGNTLSSAVTAFGQQTSSTAFMVLLGAFKALLSRYSGQTDIVVGSPIANRQREEVESLIGFFVNLLALRTDLGGAPGFREVVLRVRETALGAYAHQDLPFERLVEQVSPDRRWGRSPLFQVMFAMQNAPEEALTLPGLQVSSLELEERTAKFDLTLHITEGTEGFEAALEYSTDLFEESTIRRLAEHYCRLLEGGLSSPDTPITELALLSGDERNALLEAGRGASHPIDDHDVCSWFERQVQRTPQALALASGERSLRYAELDVQANRLAHYLHQQGAGASDLIAVGVEDGIDRVISILAVMKLGAAFLPLDSSHPADRISFVLRDSGACLLLVGAADSLPAIEMRRVSLRGDAQKIAAEPDHGFDLRRDPERLAYVIYTSGSTGRPKGVEVGHRSLTNLLSWHWRAYDVTADDRATMLAGPSFDATVWELWPYLCTGASVHIANELDRVSPPDLVKWLAEAAITIAFLPTPLAEACLEERWPEGVRLRALLTGGDRLHRTPPAGLPFRLYNNYGPTENAVVTTWAEIEPEADAQRVPPIGRPIDNVRVYVLDERRQPVPIGVPGELYIGGAGVACGYRGLTELTQMHFIADPYCGDPAARCYRTGDRVRMLAGGDLEFLGRVDAQLKVRGYRVEPGEIEAQLYRIKGVRRAVVVLREDEPGDRRLVAYVEASESDQLSPDTLRERLGDSLPDYMLPAAFVILDALPRTRNGKIDRAALPRPDSAGSDYVAPRTSLELTLSQILSDLLKLDRVGIKDNFFRIGGHSLLATQVISRVRKLLEIELPLQSLFEEPTVEGLAASIERKRWMTMNVPPALLPQPRDGEAPHIFPQSFAQQRLWFLDQLEPNTSTYNVPIVLKLEGDLNVDALRRSFSALVQRHESLRTRFGVLNGQYVQFVEDSTRTMNIALIALEALDEVERDRQLRERIAEEVHRPFDLTRSDLLRVTLLRLNPCEHILLFNIHHIITDGWSMGNLVRELAVLYRAHVEGRSAPLQPLAIQYADFVNWHFEWIQFGVMEELLHYWREKLRDAPPTLGLMTDHARRPDQSFRGSAIRFAIGKGLASRVYAFGQQTSSTAFMVLLGAFKALLSRYSGQTDIVVGSPIANRQREEVESLIGFFVNLLALRTDLGGAPGFREVVLRVRETALGAYAHQDLPFERLVEQVSPDRRWGRSPLFQVMFAMQNAPEEALTLPGLQVSSLELEERTAKFDLTLHITEGTEGFEAALEYSTDLFEESTIRRLAEHYCRLLEGGLSSPDTPITELALLSSDERDALLEMGSGQAAERPVGDGGSRRLALPAVLHEAGSTAVCIHRLFEIQAAASPSATAVVFEGQSLSYAELNLRANQLAHRIVELGVRPDDRVAICAGRSLQLVVGVLGILKAGAAYVPLDPGYPASRLEHMLGDSAPAAVLAQISTLVNLPPLSVPLIDLDEGQELAARSAANPVIGGLTAERLAYVIYTSGSSGAPKGVMVEHRNVSNLIGDWCQRHAAARQETPVVASFWTSIGFDVSVFEMFVPLALGGTVHIVPDAVRGTPAGMVDWLRSNCITFGYLPPFLVRGLSGIKDEELAALSMRHLLVGVEPLPENELWRLQVLLPGLRITNGYGPTEATVYCTVYDNVRDIHRTTPVGRPVVNGCIRILDGHGQLVPVGVAGEIHIGGAGVARGYLNQPDLTAEKFIAAPLTDRHSTRLYRSGDVARWRPDGTIEFLGRNDDQIKIRGFRIEPGEIEAALQEVPGVQRSLVLMRQDRSGEKRLVAYVEIPAGNGLTPADLRDALKRRLPVFMMPGAFVFIAALPQTTNGKIDRAALPPPEQAEFERRDDKVPPRDELERSLTRIWEQVLDTGALGINDNFFEMGGHSLMALQLQSEVFKRMGLRFPVAELIEHGTIEHLAQVLRAQIADGAVIRPAAEPFESRGVLGRVIGKARSLLGNLRTRKPVRAMTVAQLPADAVADLLVGLRPRGSMRPFFCVHPIGGDVLCYGELARNLPQDQPFYGLRSAAGMDGISTIEEMAALYLQSIRSVQPQGPYRIGGWSMGGLVAYEMAQQLLAQGESIEFLILLDSFPYEQGGSQSQIDEREMFLHFIEDHVAQSGHAAPLPAVTDSSFESHIETSFSDLQAAGILPAVMLRSEFEILWQRYRYNFLALARYRPSRYAGKLTLIMTTQGAAAKHRAPVAGWGEYAAGGISIDVLPGDHYALLRDPIVRRTAGRLAQVFDATSSTERSQAESA